MSLFSDLKNIIKPYDEDDEDFFEGADESERRIKAKPEITASTEFERSFAAPTQAAPESQPDEDAEEAEPKSGMSFLQALGLQRQARAPKTPARERTVNFQGNDTQVILFNPKSFDEAGELVSYLTASRSVVMTLEGVDLETSRRLLDFMSGIAYAFDGKITPVSAKTYFVTPHNVDIVGAQPNG